MLGDGPEVIVRLDRDGVTYTAMAFETTDGTHGRYIDWSVCTSDGRTLRQDRNEVGGGMPSREALDIYLRMALEVER